MCSAWCTDRFSPVCAQNHGPHRGHVFKTCAEVADSDTVPFVFMLRATPVRVEPNGSSGDSESRNERQFVLVRVSKPAPQISTATSRARLRVCVCVCVCVRRRHTHNTTHTHTKVERDCLSICLSVCPSVCLSVSEICGCLLPTKSVITEQRTRSLLSQKEVHTKRKQKGGAQTLLFLTKHNKGHVFHVCRVFNDPGFEKQPLVALSRKQQGRQDVHEQLQRPKRRRVSDALMALTAGNPRVPGACECVRASWRQMRGSCVSTDRCVCVCVWCVCLGQVSGLHGSGRAGVCVCVCACVCEGCLSVDLDSDCSCDQKNQRSWVVTC